MGETKPTDSKRNLTEKYKQTTLIDFGFSDTIQTCLNLFQKNHQVPSQTTTSTKIFKHVIKSKETTE
jgi:hypothetical protein